MKKQILILSLAVSLSVPQIANAAWFNSTGAAVKNLGSSIKSDVCDATDKTAKGTKSAYDDVVDAIDDTTFKTQQKLESEIEKDKASWKAYQEKQEAKKKTDAVKKEQVKKDWDTLWGDSKKLFTKD